MILFAGTSQSREEVSKAILFKSQGLYQEAIDELASVEAVEGNCQEQLDFQLLKAELLTKVGELEQVERLLSALKPCEGGPSVQIRIAKGNLLLSDGRYDQALDTLKAALSTLNRLGDNSETRMVCMSGMASANLAIGNYSSAEQIERAALNIAETAGNKQSVLYAASLNNLGLILLSQDPKKAYENYQSALRIYEGLYYFEHPKLAVSYTNLGVCNLALNRLDSALSNFETARSIWSQIYPDGHPNLALVIRNMAKTHEKGGDNTAALEYYQESLKIYKQAQGDRHPDLASTYNDLASLYLKDNQFEVGLSVLDSALMSNVMSIQLEERSYYNSLVALYSLSLKAQALEAQYLQETLRIADLKAALNIIDQSHEIIQQVRRNALAEVDKLKINSLALDIYETGIRVAVTVGDNSFNGKSYYERAFYFAEQSKSTILQGLIAESKAKKFAGIPDYLLLEEADYKSNITSIKQRLAQKPEVDMEKILQTRLYEYESKLQDLINRMEKEFPTYYDLKYNENVPSVENLRSKLGKSAALLSYFIADKTQDLYLFILTEKTFRVRISTLPTDFDKTLRGFSNSLVYNSAKAFNETSRKLHKVLFPPLPATIKEVILVPHQRLSTIPFETLLTKANKNADYTKNKYLIDKYAISYSFSYNFLNDHQDGKPEDTNILLFAPVSFIGNTGWAPLPGTMRESQTIAGLFGNRATTLLRDSANEGSLKKLNMNDYNLLHFATHGEVDEDHPELSRIILRSSEGEDGSLYTDEIYNLSLNTELVVLSACQTGLGKISRGEGLLGLSRALIYSGARNIVVSFWSVSDQSTADLMYNFYGNILSKNGLSESLQRSKIRIKSDPKYSAPYYWAPFVLNGR